MNQLLLSQKIGFIGAGNMTQSIVKGLIQTAGLLPENIWVSNRSIGKLKKMEEQYAIKIATSNEELIESSNIIVLSVKPGDLTNLFQSTAQFFTKDKIVISIAAGFTIEALEKNIPESRIIRVMPNTPALIGKGLIGILDYQTDPSVLAMTEDLFTPLGFIVSVKDEDHFEALTVACSSGVGFVFEMMQYWNEWLEQHGFTADQASQMTRKTFEGAIMLANQFKETSLEDLQARVASKKGVTMAGLESMRELEIERALRISFEKAAMRNRELARDLK